MNPRWLGLVGASYLLGSLSFSLRGRLDPAPRRRAQAGQRQCRGHQRPARRRALAGAARPAARHRQGHRCRCARRARSARPPRWSRRPPSPSSSGTSFRSSSDFAAARGSPPASALGGAPAARGARRSLAVFALTVVATRYVSLGSVLAAAAFPVLAVLFSRLGWSPVLSSSALALACACAGLVVFRHAGNLQRLFAGTERRLGEGRG